jgi:rhamnulokinase
MISLAVDIGAESGRVVTGKLVNDKLQIEEICRFSNKPIRHENTLRWNIQELINNVGQGIALRPDARSVGVDTWGVDYVLLDDKQNLVEQPFHYRDSRTNGIMERLATPILYQETGIQFLPFNTIFQLASCEATVFKKAKHFLTIPDYIHHQLSAEKRIVSEYTNATTTQLLDAKTGDWSKSLVTQLGLDQSLFPAVIQPGTSLGKTANGIQELIAPACHDTGSAVAAIPSSSNDVAWISSGTWSILGVELPAPLITDESYRLNYTNEGGICGTVRLCKNVMGLWILQECRRDWEDTSYSDLQNEAERSPSLNCVFDVDDPSLLSPSNNDSKMEARIVSLLAENNQPPPNSRGQVVRLILESLAAKYAKNLDELQILIGRQLNAIHVFGGGSQNKLLNQLTANACNRPVIAGPVEATAIGNVLMQLMALSEISSLQEARHIVRNSFECQIFDPSN